MTGCTTRCLLMAFIIMSVTSIESILAGESTEPSVASFGTATTTSAPDAAHKQLSDDDDDHSDPNDSTLDDFEDTQPDDVVAEPSGPSAALVGISRALEVFDTLSTVWQKVNAAQYSASTSSSASLSASSAASSSARGMTETTDDSPKAGPDAATGRYIQGDPLNGYYDFLITEGSYKFWAVFQLLTAGLMIYSTFAAIYYSKVNPIVSDYDYVSYLGGRSLGSASAGRSADGDGAHPLTSLLNAGWMHSAAHGFEWVLDAVESLPAYK